MEPTVRKCMADDLETLRKISCDTYKDTFGSLNTPANMEAYLERAFE